MSATVNISVCATAAILSMYNMDSLRGGTTQSCGCLSRNKDIPLAMRDTFVGGTQISKIQSIPTKANKSGAVGVNWDKSRNKWQASIRFRGRKYALGRFDNFDDAVEARKEGERKYFGGLLDDLNNDDNYNNKGLR